MRFIVSSSALFNRLQTIGRVINSKNMLPILDCFLFEIQDNILTITASDSETTLITNLELVESDANARFCINAKTIQDSMKRNCGTTSFFRYQSGQHGNHGQLPERTFQHRGTKCRRIPGNEPPAGGHECPHHTGRNDAQRHKPLPVRHGRRRIASGDERGIFRHPSRQPDFCLYRRAQIGTQQKLRYQRPSARSLYPSQEAGYDSEKTSYRRNRTTSR